MVTQNLLAGFRCPGYLRQDWPIPATAAGLGSGGGRTGGVWPWLAGWQRERTGWGIARLDGIIGAALLGGRGDQKKP